MDNLVKFEIYFIPKPIHSILHGKFQFLLSH